MLIGTGMISTSFYKFKDNKNIIIFASGVSNSNEKRKECFLREFNLLKKISNKNKNKKIIYFSTCSIFDKSISNSKYIKHKLKIEKYIKKNIKKYIIFRLPIVIGKTSNPHTLFNFIKEKILNNEPIDIYKFSHRYIIDVDDLGEILSLMILSKKYNNKTLNISFNNKQPVIKIVKKIENILQKKIKKNIIKKGYNYDINNKRFLNFLKKNNIKVNKNYNSKVLTKYLK